MLVKPLKWGLFVIGTRKPITEGKLYGRFCKLKIGLKHSFPCGFNPSDHKMNPASGFLIVAGTLKRFRAHWLHWRRYDMVHIIWMNIYDGKSAILANLTDLKDFWAIFEAFSAILNKSPSRRTKFNF